MIENHPNAAVLWFLNAENDRVRPHLFLFMVNLRTQALILEVKGVSGQR